MQILPDVPLASGENFLPVAVQCEHYSTGKKMTQHMPHPTIAPTHADTTRRSIFSFMLAHLVRVLFSGFEHEHRQELFTLVAVQYGKRPHPYHEIEAGNLFDDRLPRTREEVGFFHTAEVYPTLRERQGIIQ